MTNHAETTITFEESDNQISIPFKTDTRTVLMDLRACDHGAFRFIRSLALLVGDSGVRSMLVIQKVNGRSGMTWMSLDQKPAGVMSRLTVLIDDQKAAEIEITEIGNDQVIHFVADANGESIVVLAHAEATYKLSARERAAIDAAKAKLVGQPKPRNEKPLRVYSKHYSMRDRMSVQQMEMKVDQQRYLESVAARINAATPHMPAMPSTFPPAPRAKSHLDTLSVPPALRTDLGANR